MPYAQIHYPFENRDLIDKGEAFPADFINEGVDQTRGWFFTLHAIATMIFDSVAFKNVISSGLVLDAKGNKMSKHVGNVVNPFEMIEKYGSDAVRLYMMTNSEPWDNLKFDPEGVDEVRRKFFGTLYNTYSFFALYANVDGWEPGEQSQQTRPEIDRWILSSLNTLIKKVTEELDGYDPTRAGRLIDAFVNDDLSNWFVRLNRKRFWGKEMSADKRSAYETLYTCLLTVSKLLAPFAPFYADQLYKDLGGEKDSVHLDKFPVADEQLIDRDLETRMEMAQKITSMVLALRRKVNIKVRQPLQAIMIPATEEQKRHIEAVKDLIMNEVNVKELRFVEGAGILVKKVKCNFRVMGKKFGKQMKAVASAVDALSQEQIAELEANGKIVLEHLAGLDGLDSLEILAEDVEIISEDIPGWLVSNEGSLTVALEVELTDELRQEGMAREIINRVQNIRKDSGLEIVDRIHITLAPNAEIEAAVNSYGDYIKTQVLADDITIAPNDGTEVEFDEFKLNINITKA
jgi:isoleucyl-tRNA synthetase